MAMNIKKGDRVKVIAGDDRGTEGEVLRAYPADERVVVEKVNVVTKALRPTQQNPQGGLSHVEAPIHVSNVALVCPSCKKAGRFSIKRENGKKTRVCKACGKDID